jgi:hypothetical protein
MHLFILFLKILVCSLRIVVIVVDTGVINARVLSLVLDFTVKNVKTLICVLAATPRLRFHKGYFALLCIVSGRL